MTIDGERFSAAERERHLAHTQHTHTLRRLEQAALRVRLSNYRDLKPKARA